MRSFWKSTHVLVLFSLLLSGCVPIALTDLTPTQSTMNCSEPICVDVQIATPIPFNQPVDAYITVRASQVFTTGSVILDKNDPSVIIESTSAWALTIGVNEIQHYTTTIRFTTEGNAGVNVFAGNAQYLARNSESVSVRQGGGTPNPTPGSNPSVIVPLLNPPTSSAPEPTYTPIITQEIVSIGAEVEVNVPIPDDGTWLTYTLPITSAPSDAIVSAVLVKIAITHARGKDLVVEAVSPNGTVYRIWNRQEPIKRFNYVIVGSHK